MAECKDCLKQDVCNRDVGHGYSVCPYYLSADVAKVKHVEWDASGRYKFADGGLAIRCSECGSALHEDEYEKYFWNYCPNCGAKMDGTPKERGG